MWLPRVLLHFSQNDHLERGREGGRETEKQTERKGEERRKVGKGATRRHKKTDTPTHQNRPGRPNLSVLLAGRQAR